MANLDGKYRASARLVAACVVAIAILAASLQESSAVRAQATMEMTVTVEDSGLFAVDFSRSAFALGELAVDTPAESSAITGTATLRVTDTHSYRGSFSIQIQTSDFASNVPVPYPNSTAYFSIPARRLVLTAVSQPAQLRCSCDRPGYLYPVGDIYAVAQDGNWGSAFYDWTFANTLDQKRLVAHGLAGSGTIETTQDLAIHLSIPAALPAGTYTSTLTATYNFDIP